MFGRQCSAFYNDFGKFQGLSVEGLLLKTAKRQVETTYYISNYNPENIGFYA